VYDWCTIKPLTVLKQGNVRIAESITYLESAACPKSTPTSFRHANLLRFKRLRIIEGRLSRKLSQKSSRVTRARRMLCGEAKSKAPRSLGRVERALPARGVEGQMKRQDRLNRQDPIHHSGIVFDDRPHLRLVSRIVQDQSA
jgi:hypothetical protein